MNIRSDTKHIHSRAALPYITNSHNSLKNRTYYVLLPDMDRKRTGQSDISVCTYVHLACYSDVCVHKPLLLPSVVKQHNHPPRYSLAQQ